MTVREGNSRIVVVHSGGLGDLILLSELIASVKQAHPQNELTLICRAEFTAIADCYPVPPDEVVGLPFQPYAWAQSGEALHTILSSILSKFAGVQVWALVDAALRPNWLAEFLTAALEPEMSFSCGLGLGPVGPLPELLERFGLDRRPVCNLHLPAGTHERNRYRLLGEALESPFIRGTMPWPLSEVWRQPALNWLGSHGLEPRKYLVCAPFGAASTPVKRWPMESFIDVLHRFFRDWQWPVLLMGAQTEQESLRGMKSRLSGIPASCFAGRPEDLPVVAGILSMAGGYLSNDAGLMHLAQAFEVPGVAIFGGGGEWPAYAPWAPGSAGLCHPLPCFGCGWDCFLGHGLCVETISGEQVHEALRAVCRAPSQAPYNVILKTLEEPLLGLVTDASARYREAELDRSERLQVIAELERSRRQLVSAERDLAARLKEAEARAATMELVAIERLALLERVHGEAAMRLNVIQQIGEQSEERRRSVEQLAGSLERSEAARRELEQALRLAQPTSSDVLGALEFDAP